MQSKTVLFFLLAAGALLVPAAGAPLEAANETIYDALEGQAPYYVQVYFFGSATGAGVILSENYVLTLVTCVAYPEEWTVIFGGSNDRWSGLVKVRSAELLFHPEDKVQWRNTPVLLRLSQSLVFSPKIQPIPLAEKNPPAGAAVHIVGFRRLNYVDPIDMRKLQYFENVMLEDPVIDEATNAVDPSLIALGHSREAGVCVGEYGGPAVHNGELVGIAAFNIDKSSPTDNSLGLECTSDPDVYISINQYREWILTTIAETDVESK